MDHNEAAIEALMDIGLCDTARAVVPYHEKHVETLPEATYKLKVQARRCADDVAKLQQEFTKYQNHMLAVINEMQKREYIIVKKVEKLEQENLQKMENAICHLIVGQKTLMENQRNLRKYMHHNAPWMMLKQCAERITLLEGKLAACAGQKLVVENAGSRPHVTFPINFRAQLAE